MIAFSRHRRAILLLGILALAAFFRFYLLTAIPPGLYPDEAANGNNALEALRTGDFKVFYPENNGREGLFINLQALAVALLGAEPWVLRSVSALFGTLTILGIYLASRELFPSRDGIALLAAFFSATSFWHINFSRIGFRAILLPFFAAFALYWLLKAIRTGKISSAIAAGIATGLGFHTYIGFRFMPFVLAIPIVFGLMAWRRGRMEHCAPCSIALFLFAAFIAALPLGFYFIQNPADFAGRSGQVSIFSSDSPLAEFIRSNLLTAGMFFTRGDCNPRHNLACQPQLFWSIGVIFLIGLILSIRQAARNRKAETGNTTLLAWLFFMALPATLTREGLPHALRAIGMIPPVMMIAAVGGLWLWRKLNAYFNGALLNPKYAAYHGQLKRIKKELAVAALLFLLWIPITAYRDYFVRFAYAPQTADAFSADLLQAGRYLASLPDGVQKFVIVNLSGEDIRGLPAPAQTVMFASDSFDPERRRQKQISYLLRPEDIAIDGTTRTAIIPLNPKDQDLVQIVRKRFPMLREKLIGNTLVFKN
ncbi:MAG: glycosyltransferase family 39 protein [Candidatus Sungbacteria bacterium]|uniref:Glycosyltransferase family 39 protein n=1 Tax=Candidatus Sungiibacteriota bacterium TaxID=2750080 RepID=A0A932YXW9_9BACT|nr:glycosyltransferase family 39 protein [Candidatus Sungbacteria bacterium]